MVTTSNSGRAKIWNAHTFTQLNSYSISSPNYAKFSKDNSMIAIAANQNNIVILSSSGSFITNVNSGQTQVNEVDFNENTNRMISCGQAQQTNFYSINAGPSFVNSFNTGPLGSSNTCCRFNRNTNDIAVGYSGTGYINGYNTNSMAGGPNTRSLTGTISAVAWNDITQQAYFANTNGKVYLLSTNGNLDNTLTVGNQVNTVAVTEDGNYAVFGGQNGTIFVYNVSKKNSEQLDVKLNESTSSITATAFSFDGQYLAAGNNQGSIYIYKRTCAGCPVGAFVNATDCILCS
jgi:WD40 repeat protein